ncbi:MAG TPA: serine/threonine protein kinase, partial [Cyanobacteria bacterium UBA11368]|nr:serine/threonine protein kinase [Cyanobacteria bacterium UBA11368]
AYSLIPEKQKKSTHLRIGKLLLNNTRETEREERIFEVVNQLNYGVELLAEPSDRYQLAELNLIAGRKAKASTAYAAAVGYFSVGRQLLAINSWQTQYEQTLALYVAATEAAYLNTDFEQMDKLAEVVLQQAKTLIDKVKVYEIQIQACIAQNNLLEAVNTALKVLNLLGVEFPQNPNQLDIQRGLEETTSNLTNRRIEDLINLPEMTDQQKLAAMRILLRVTAAAFIATPVLYPLMVFKLVNLSLTYGNGPISSIAYANYGIILCGVVGDIESGYKFAQLALSVLNKFNAKDIKAQVLCLVNAFTLHWKQHAKEPLKNFQEAYQTGLETGDLEHAAWAAGFHSSYFSYFIGKELGELEREMVTYGSQIAQFKQKTALNYNAIFKQAVFNLLGRSADACCLIGESCDEQTLLPIYQQVNDILGINLLYTNKAILCYLFGEYAQAVENSALAEKYLDGVTAMLVVPVFHFYDSLARLAVYPHALESEANSILSKVTANQQKMKQWADCAPKNHLHKFYLVEAERHRVLEQKIDAINCYNQAIASAKENEYIQEEALANELTAKFYLGWGREKIAQVYLTDAYYAYARWGAKAKVEDLEKRYPQLLAPILQREIIRSHSNETLAALSIHSTETTLSSSSTKILAELDLASVIKASQTLSSEIQLDKLIATLMQVVLENAGAQKCVLVLPQGDNLVIEAIAQLDQAQSSAKLTVLRSQPVEESQEIPQSAINYVKRTLETLVIQDATAKTDWAADPYMHKQQPKSILCGPILNQGKLIGILYLENNLILGAFTSSRIEILNLLCAQAAISLENARLYQTSQQLYHQSQNYAQKLEKSLQE